MSDKTDARKNKTGPVTLGKIIEKGDLPRDIARALDHLWCFVADDLDESGEEDVQIDDIRVNCTGDLIVTFTRNVGKGDKNDANDPVEAGKVELKEQRPGWANGTRKFA